MCDDIQVSVCVVTYNQENYIAECLDSIVSQKTNFNFEIIIGEDCSTDGTRAIVREYADNYPNLFVPIFYDKNVGGVENLKQVYKKAQGKYIAHMDGDDMMLPNKLQKQFDILEVNPDCNACSHNMKSIDKDGKNKKESWSYPENKYELFDLYKKLPFFAHSSKMFINKYPEEFWDNLLCEPYILDIDIHVANLEDGQHYHIEEDLGVYRSNSGVTTINSKVNPILPLGVERVFEKGLHIFANDQARYEEMKRFYAFAMLQYAHSYAVLDKDKEKFKEYINKSVSQSDIGIKQKILRGATIIPTVSFFLLSIRKMIKDI